MKSGNNLLCIDIVMAVKSYVLSVLLYYALILLWL